MKRLTWNTHNNNSEILHPNSAYRKSSLQLIFVFLCLSFISRSQTVDWSPPQTSDEKNAYTTILGQNSEGIYVLRQNYRLKSRNIILEQYSAELKPLTNKSFLTKKEDLLLQILLQATEIQLFYCTLDKLTKTENVYVKRLSFNLTQKGNDSLLLSIEDKDFDYDYLHVIKPRNYNYTLLFAPKINLKIPNSYNYLLLDSALNLKNKGEIGFDITNPYTIEQAAYTTNDISLLIREDVPKKIFKDGFHYSILYGKYDRHSLKAYPLYNDSLNVSEGILKADYVNHHFVFAGIYYLKDSGYYKGYYLWNQHLDSDQTLKKEFPFREDVIQSMNGRNSKERGISDIRIGDMILRLDGGIILISEEYRYNREMIMEMNVYGSIPQNNYRYYYYYNNILLLSIAKNGKTDWSHILRKDQVSMNDNGVYSSYLLHAMPDKLLFAYNDLSRKRWLLSSYKVNPDGTSENNILIHPSEYEGRIVPRDGSQVSPNEFIMPGFTDKGQVLVRIKF